MRSGILLVDKPADWTSFDVVAKLKGVFHTGRIGHSGTLDPLATGLLVLFIGRATRAVEFAEAQEKRYIASFRPGTVTDTQDITGNVLSRNPFEGSIEDIRRAAEFQSGQIMQVPPMYSAIKINGQRLYDIARKGNTVEREPRKITVFSNKVTGVTEDGDYVLDITCSKGTYIRTVCNDMGEYLGCGGCMSALRRVSAGNFSVEDAHSIEEICALAEERRAEELLLGVDSLFSHLGRMTVNEDAEKKLRCGSSLKAGGDISGRLRVYSQSGEFLALSEVVDGRIVTIKSFFEVG